MSGGDHPSLERSGMLPNSGRCDECERLRKMLDRAVDLIRAMPDTAFTYRQVDALLQEHSLLAILEVKP